MIKQGVIRVGKDMYASGMIAGTWGNISSWDEDRSAFWITPSGMDYLTLKEEDLVLINLEGNVLEGHRIPSTEFRMHLEVYKGRPDVKGIVHTHSIYSTAHAVANEAIPPIVEDLVQIVGGSVEISHYELPGTEELAKSVVTNLGVKNAVLLGNHGMVGVGRTLIEAFKVCQVVEKSAHIHLMSKILGNPILIPETDINKMRKDFLTKYGQK